MADDNPAYIYAPFKVVLTCMTRTEKLIWRVVNKPCKHTSIHSVPTVTCRHPIFITRRITECILDKASRRHLKDLVSVQPMTAPVDERYMQPISEDLYGTLELGGDEDG